MKVLFTLIGLLLNSLLWAQAPAKITIQVDPSANMYSVSLPANPTTGYQWQLKSYDQSFQLMSGSKYIAPKSSLIGAGGTMKFTFVQRKNTQWPDQTSLQFEYSQSWEPGSGTSTRVDVVFAKEGTDG